MFVEYPTEKKHKNANAGANEANADNIKLPVFLIPGILGNFNELQSLAEELDKLAESERPIYIYLDPRVHDPDTAKPEPSLQAHGKTIAEEIKNVLKPNAMHPLIVGYSFGCHLATIAAQHLKDENFESTVCLIDGASSALSTEYFKSNSQHSTRDLVNILNYAAKLSGFNKEFTPAEHEIEKWTQLPLSQRINSIEETIAKTNQNHLITTKFKLFAAIAKQNLKNLTYHIPNYNPKLDKLSVLLTNETAKKYGVATGGWENYTNKLNLINNPSLLNQTHTALVQGSNILALGKSINDIFVKEATPENVFSSSLEFILRTFNWMPNYQEVLAKTIQSVSPSNSSEDSRSVDTDSERENFSNSSHSSGSSTPTDQISDGEDENERLSNSVSYNKNNLSSNQATLFAQKNSAPIAIPQANNSPAKQALSNSSTSL